MTVQAYIRVLFRWWWLLLLGIALGVAAGYGAQVLLGTVALGSLESYSATAILSLGTETEGMVQDESTLSLSESLVPTYVELATRPPITNRVVERLGLPISAGKLASSHLEASQPEKTQLIEITGKYPDPVIAAAIANEAALLLQEFSPVRPMRLVQVVSLASVPESPDPDPYLLITVSGLVGLLLALGMILLTEFALDRPYTAEWAAARLELPILGTFSRKSTPGRPNWLGQKKSAATAPNDPVWWGVMATLDRATETFSGAKKHGKSIVVTGPQRTESKMAAAMALASAAAASGKRTILVDADVRGANLGSWLNLTKNYGLSTLALNGYSGEGVKDLLVPAATAGYSVLPAGPRTSESGKLTREGFWQSLLADLSNQADLIIINGPAIDSAPEVMALAASADGMLEVMDLGKTRAPLVNETKELLDRAGVTILGVVLNEN